MLSLSLGPLALPVAPLVIAGSFLLANWVALRGFTPADPLRREKRKLVADRLQAALLLTLVAARLGHVLLNLSAYAPKPWLALDIRDGGWVPWAGVLAGAAWLGWRAAADAFPPVSKAVWRGAAAGLLAWTVAQAGLNWKMQQTLQTTGPGAWTEVAVTALQSTPGTAPSASGAAAAPGDVPAPTASGYAVKAEAGGVHRLGALAAGRPTVINLWATWCAPCRAEMPAFAAAAAANPKVNFLFVNQGESADTVRSWLARERIALPQVWLDRSSSAGPALGSAGLPTTLFLNADGKVLHTHVGEMSSAGLQVQLLKIHP